MIAKISKSTLKIKTYLIIGKKKLVKTKKAQNWILFIIPSVSKKNRKRKVAGMSGSKEGTLVWVRNRYHVPQESFFVV